VGPEVEAVDGEQNEIDKIGCYFVRAVPLSELLFGKNWRPLEDVS